MSFFWKLYFSYPPFHIQWHKEIDIMFCITNSTLMDRTYPNALAYIKIEGLIWVKYMLWAVKVWAKMIWIVPSLCRICHWLYIIFILFFIYYCLYCLHHNLFAYIVCWHWLKQSREINRTNYCFQYRCYHTCDNASMVWFVHTI